MPEIKKKAWTVWFVAFFSSFAVLETMGALSGVTLSEVVWGLPDYAIGGIALALSWVIAHFVTKGRV